MRLKLILSVLAVAPALYAADTNAPAQPKPGADPLVQRGKYLVVNVALCAACHTPRTDQGEYDRAQWLQGNLLDFKPDHPMVFAAVAPPIAGMPGFNDVQALKFLETGIDLTGKTAMYPMPAYRFNHDDAQAVLAYLRSLKH